MRFCRASSPLDSSRYERGGKRKTDYSPYIEPAKARLEELIGAM